MNRLIVDDEKVYLEGDNSIILKEDTKFLDVKSLNLKVLRDADLSVECNCENVKISITVNVLKDVHLNLYEIKKGGIYKIRYIYYLEKGSKLYTEKINDVTKTSEESIFNLNGDRAQVVYNFKTVSKSKEKYNFLVYHNASKTISDIINNGVNIDDGKLEFNVSSFVPNKVVKCRVNQSSRIINETSNKCIIKPNLFIDEEDVAASHSALIGTFSSDEIFYLMSRGIEKKEAKMMLSKGFLLKGITQYKDELNKVIDNYWG